MKSISRFLALAFAAAALMLASFATPAYAVGFHADHSVLVSHAPNSHLLSTVPAPAGNGSSVESTSYMTPLIANAGMLLGGNDNSIAVMAVADWRSPDAYSTV